MDNGASQNSALAKNTMNPTRSRDLNPIENLFHVIRKCMRQEAIKKNIVHETWPQFVTRVRNYSFIF